MVSCHAGPVGTLSMRQYLSRMAAARRWHESTRFTRSSLVCRFFSASRARCALRLPAATREVWRPFGKGQRMEEEKRQRIRAQTAHRADQSPDHAHGGSEPGPRTRTGRIRARTTHTHKADQSPDHAQSGPLAPPSCASASSSLMRRSSLTSVQRVRTRLGLCRMIPSNQRQHLPQNSRTRSP